jgi:hypothetical protein
MVGESGAKGGYAYRFDTGFTGETWFVAHSLDPERWNIRISVKSLNLALRGYEEVKQHLLQTLSGLGAICSQERISRFDYCFDFAMEGFQPEIENFVTHRRCTKRVHLGESGGEIIINGRNIQSLRIGTMPGRQIALYNKTREIVARNKPHWWHIWELDAEEFAGEIWRVEVRSGKDDLDQWNLRSFEDFGRKAGDVIIGALKSKRYTCPSGDSNPSRWPTHPLWSACLEAAQSALAPYSSNAERKRLIDERRENLIAMFDKAFVGNFVAYAALVGGDQAEFSAIAQTVMENTLTFAERNPEAMAEKHRKAMERYGG